ncbi:BCCT family transporter [Pseudogracilibacillus auburnensis]|uniref:Glycine betaine transporter n=1 Tax=Pseudogracilibacillus auburnensis TaxID=1494959 RepID=A0A2V3VJE9_9BACI|nr:BCCT family transporter [Pseudogracilibacillus auburnensis]PXW80918.1 glycine betaine transporter [Pseudogracilibacillus auburnensis]
MKGTTPVFMISVCLAVIFILWGAIAPSHLESVSSNIQQFLQTRFGWFYLISASTFLLFTIYLAFSKYGNIKLGKDDDEPEYSTFSWFAMLFSAGMGIGLVFWGIAEPISHFYVPPFGDAQTPEAAENALRFAFFHWGLHPWGIYALIALALAYFKFRKNAPGTISATFYPLLGKHVNGPIGKTIDLIAVFATVFGVATSLGLGAIQINGGFSYLNNNIPNNFNVQMIIIIGVTILFMLSAISGLGRGIKWLSNINILLAILLMLFFLILGPTTFLLNLFTTTIGSYVEYLPKMSFRLAPFSDENSEWIQGWTIFYWAWWIAWSPFVGTFIARVSKGRTIRELIMGVLAVPTIFCALWFAIFGGTGIHVEMFGNGGIWEAMEHGNNTEIALFATLSHLPLSTIASVLSIVLISTFFITSADSATFVIGMQTTNGMLNPPLLIKIVWGIIQASAAAVLLWSGGLTALQTASIVSAFPFVIILIFMMFSLHKGLKQEGPTYPKKRKVF